VVGRRVGMHYNYAYAYAYALPLALPALCTACLVVAGSGKCTALLCLLVAGLLRLALQ